MSMILMRYKIFNEPGFNTTSCVSDKIITLFASYMYINQKRYITNGYGFL